MDGRVIEVVDEDDDVARYVAASGLTLVEFSAEGCPPCERYAPVFSSSAARHPDVPHVSVDVDYRPDLADDFDVRGVPTTVVLRDGTAVASVSGALTASRLEELLDSARAGGEPAAAHAARTG